MLDPKRLLKSRIFLSLVVLFGVLVILGSFAVVRAHANQNNPGNTVVSQNSANRGIGFIAAGVAFGLGALGAGIGIGNVGAAAMGAIAEKPEIAGQALIFVALAEGLVIFGFIMGLMILGKV